MGIKFIRYYGADAQNFISERLCLINAKISVYLENSIELDDSCLSRVTMANKGVAIRSMK